MEYRSRKTNPAKTIIFILIGGALIIMTDLFVFGGINKIWPDRKNMSGDISIDVSSLRQQHGSYMDDGIYIDPVMLSKAMPPTKTIEATGKESFASLSEQSITIDEILANKRASELAQIKPAIGVEGDFKSEVLENNAEIKELVGAISEVDIELVPKAKPEEKSTTITYQYDEPKGHGMIAIIIDDMGVSLRSKLVEVLPAPLTLSYLPYAKNLKERTARAAANGHELMVHIPMEPIKSYIDGGPKVLKSSQNETEFMNVLDWGLTQFDGFVGINNHMGSKLTQDKNAMHRVMDYLKVRDDNLYFIDSKTINSSIAANVASKKGVSYNERDVFLDHEINKEFIEASLKKLEAIANKKGYAIAIGHPHKETIAALKKWLPTLENKGLTLVPMSRLVKHPKAVNDNLVAER